MTLQIRDEKQCRWDIISLGEVMLRLDPEDGRIRTARTFRVCEGGGEYNVTRGLRRCFGMRAALATAIPDSDVGRLLEDFLLNGGVDLSHVKWVPYDGFGRANRVGLNFTERGFGVRGARGTSDRAYSAASGLKPGDIDWEKVFGAEGSRWFHTGGIFAGLSPTTLETAMEAMTTARKHGTLVSYDLNYRPSIWKAIGGKDAARKANRAIASLVDVMIGNEEDFSAALGFEVEGTTDDYTSLDPTHFKKMIAQVMKEFPNLKAIATTLRAAKTATKNDWGAVLYIDGAFHEAFRRENLEIFDRVGGGDSFASGLIYGFLTGRSPADCVNLGAAHGALAMTTSGDTSMATLEEVESLVKGGAARIQR